MKRYYASIFIVFFLLTQGSLSWAQENKSQITIDITREVDGKTEKFSKTYASADEMESDKELQSFSKDLEQVTHVAVSPGGSQTIKIHKTDSSSSYDFDFDTEMNKVVRKVRKHDNTDDDSLSIILQKKIDKLEAALANLGMDINEEIEVLEDMEWDEIKERHKIVILDKNEEEEKDELFLEEDTKKKTMTITTVDGNELGKKGKVSNNETLNLEVLDYYPNPSHGRFRLKFQVQEEEPLHVKVYNKDGQEVYLRYFPRYSGAFSELIDLREQDAGKYLLEISHGQKRLVRKLVIQ